MNGFRQTPTVWLMPCILLVGGCAGPALLSPQRNQEEAPESPAASVDATDEVQQPPLDVAEAALIRRMALQRGYSEAAAEQLEQSILRTPPRDRDFLIQIIYAEMNRRRPDAGARVASDHLVSPAATATPPQPTPDSACHVEPATVEPATVEPATVEPATTVDSSATASASAPAGAKPAAEAERERATESDATEGAHQGQPQQNTPTTESDADAAEQPPAIEASPRGSTEDRPATEQSAKTTQPIPSATHAQDPAGQHAAEQASGQKQTSDTSALAANQETELADDDAQAELSAAPHDEELSWQRQLQLATARLRRQLVQQEDMDPLQASRLRACLGLLQLAAENPERAMEALEGLDEDELEFWRQTLMGLDILMDSNSLPKLRYRVEFASEHIQNGLSALSNLSPLRVENLAFVSNVRSFGDYKEIAGRRFAAQQEVILYVEIANFTVEQLSDDAPDELSGPRRRDAPTQVPLYEAELLGRYDILDQNQRVVMSRTLPLIRDRCRRHRRDFFIAYPLFMPKIDEGYYTLELTIEDKKGEKFGFGTIDFEIH